MTHRRHRTPRRHPAALLQRQRRQRRARPDLEQHASRQFVEDPRQPVGETHRLAQLAHPVVGRGHLVGGPIARDVGDEGRGGGCRRNAANRPQIRRGARRATPNERRTTAGAGARRCRAPPASIRGPPSPADDPETTHSADPLTAAIDSRAPSAASACSDKPTATVAPSGSGRGRGRVRRRSRERRRATSRQRRTLRPAHPGCGR